MKYVSHAHDYRQPSCSQPNGLAGMEVDSAKTVCVDKPNPPKKARSASMQPGTKMPSNLGPWLVSAHWLRGEREPTLLNKADSAQTDRLN